MVVSVVTLGNTAEWIRQQRWLWQRSLRVGELQMDWLRTDNLKGKQVKPPDRNYNTPEDGLFDPN